MKKTSLAVILSGMAILPINAQDPMIVAHRGASQDAPENTLLAFRLAWKQGADAIEGDFHLSKDGVLVCIHDAKTNKLADRDLVVAESTLSELRVLDVGAGFGADFKGAMIPTIAEVLATVPPGKTIYVEIKCGPEAIPILMKELEQSGLPAQHVVVISFNEVVIRTLKVAAPGLKAYWLRSFKTDRFGKATPSLESVLHTLHESEADGLSSNVKIPEVYIHALKQAGFEWHVWTVNDSGTAKRMKALGARSITTDVPGRMRSSLAP
ncbi:glycerophosphodiester phosphodiesterase [Coraliomargarita sinensis]|uniref:Glycerophosphodiester phosphodiesterase n=1 Tax=Coraliomargarita sinensis TaxID=2174842 RepID=A0A317ZGM9_9BACT|nr:glycerophosphodiester phosphodiesterase [Coraliomargarita sinensis]PXA04590.1 glycerophosphodiester phosphodiesterase [Coraliomargarita sinensis]